MNMQDRDLLLFWMNKYKKFIYPFLLLFLSNCSFDNKSGIWQNENFDNFRKNYRDTCGSCDLWTIDQVDTHQIQWQPESKPALNIH